MVLANSSVLKQRTQKFLWILLVVTGMTLAATDCPAYQDSSHRPIPIQNLPKANTAKAPATQDWMADFRKNPELLSEISKLVSRVQQEVHLPGPRRQSQILPKLTDSTNAYAAFPNYGEALNQAHLIFKQQLKDSPALREWWQKSEINKSDPKLDDMLDLLYQFSQYLGDEIVASGSYKDKTGVVIAEIKKPGLDKFLPEMYKTLSGKSGGRLQVVNPQELATAKALVADNAWALVRSDFVVIGSDLGALRAVNARLDAGKKAFSSTAFGQRMSQAYVDGAGMLVGVDLQPMVPDFTRKDSERALLQASGFADMKYAVWELNDHNGGAELSFISPRHGIASWLANSTQLGGLDFLSPAATMAGSIVLKSPAQILDDYRDIATSINPSSLDTLAQMQMGLGIDLRNDLLSKLDGEIAYEVDTPVVLNAEPVGKQQLLDQQKPAAPPTWRLALRVNDPIGLQQTFTKLLAASRMEVKHLAEGRFTVHSFQVPSGPEPLKINYTFADGYLLIGSSRAAISEALRVHQAGESLAKSAKFRAALPDNQAQVASALYYQNMASWISMVMKQLPPELAQSMPQFSPDVLPSVSALYGSDRAIRMTGGNNATSAGVVLVVAAIAIPNLLRAKNSANESAAASTIKTINTAQVTYAVSYPNNGYAADLATLGPGASEICDDPKSVTDKHACLLDAVLGNGACISGKWCKKGAYNYRVSAICRFGTCAGYVAVAIPANADTATRSFCSVEDAVVRFKVGAPIGAPISAAECRRWAPVQ